jgi:hypothetical protein
VPDDPPVDVRSTLVDHTFEDTSRIQELMIAR